MSTTGPLIYLVHLNPMTTAHESIISRLKKDYRVYIFPVRFIKDGQEVNTKSFPFSFQLRKQMVESVLGDSVVVLPDYTFYAPYNKYHAATPFVTVMGTPQPDNHTDKRGKVRLIHRRQGRAAYAQGIQAQPAQS